MSGFRVVCLLVLLALCVSLSMSQLFYDYGGKEESIQLTQLWNEGYWQKVRKASSNDWFWNGHL